MANNVLGQETEGQKPRAGADLPSFDVVEVEKKVSIVERSGRNGTRNGSTGVTAHELHNLISVIIAEAQLLQLDHPVDAPNYQSAVAIERAGRRLETLIDRLTAVRGRKSAQSGTGGGDVTPEVANPGPRIVMAKAAEATGV